MKIAGVWYGHTPQTIIQELWRVIHFFPVKERFCFRRVIRRTPGCQNCILSVVFLAHLG